MFDQRRPAVRYSPTHVMTEHFKQIYIVLWLNKNREKKDNCASLKTSTSTTRKSSFNLCELTAATNELWYCKSTVSVTLGSALQNRWSRSVSALLSEIQHSNANHYAWMNFSPRLSGMLIRLYFQICFMTLSALSWWTREHRKCHRFSRREVEGSLSQRFSQAALKTPDLQD